MGNAVAPFERGWWLTAYLFLVGGLAQLLLIRGQEVLTAGPREPPASLIWMQWGLWNVGTATVAVADMAQIMAALTPVASRCSSRWCCTRSGLEAAGGKPERQASAFGYGYAALRVVLGGSVLLGTFLAGALPGQ